MHAAWAKVRVGVLTSGLPAVSGTPTGPAIDQADVVAIDLSESGAQLGSGSQVTALALNSLCYVDGDPNDDQCQIGFVSRRALHRCRAPYMPIINAILAAVSAIASAASALMRLLDRRADERAGAAEAELAATNRALEREKIRAQMEMEVAGLSSDSLSDELRNGPSTNRR